MRLVLGQDKLIAQWVANRIPYVRSGADAFGPSVAIGIAEADRMIAAAVYHDHCREYATMSISLAADTARWATRGNIRAFLHYPFEQAKVNVLWHAILQGNDRMMKLSKGLGFVHEAYLKDRFGPGRNACISRMQPKEYYRLLERFAANTKTAKAA